MLIVQDFNPIGQPPDLTVKLRRKVLCKANKKGIVVTLMTVIFFFTAVFEQIYNQFLQFLSMTLKMFEMSYSEK